MLKNRESIRDKIFSKQFNPINESTVKFLGYFISRITPQLRGEWFWWYIEKRRASFFTPFEYFLTHPLFVIIPLEIIYFLNYTVYSIQYTLYSIHYTVYTIQCTLYSVHYTVYTIQYTLYSIHYTVYTIQYTPLFKLNWTWSVRKCTIKVNTSDVLL